MIVIQLALIILALLNTLFTMQHASSQEQGQFLREKLPYSRYFEKDSDVTAVFVSCSTVSQLKITLQSFLFFNTYPLKKLLILHCGDKNSDKEEKKKLSQALPIDASANTQYIELKFVQNSQTHSLINELFPALFKIDTKFIYLSDTTWQSKKGYGFIEEAKNIFSDTKIQHKISQIITTYPYWRIVASLEPLQWAQTGEAFHKISAFNPDSFNYFSFNPSLINRKQLINEAFQGNPLSICQKYGCNIKNQQFDKCCIWVLGQELFRKNYTQIYYNDGTSIPNVVYINH